MNYDNTSIQDYYGMKAGVAEKEKQTFEEAMKNANDFFVKGLLKVKKQKDFDIQTEVEEYRKIAKTAFSNRRYNEAREYFGQILSLLELDYEAVFYYSLCKGLGTQVDANIIDEVCEAYQKAVQCIPIELDWDNIVLEYSINLADLIIAWFKLSQNEYYNSRAEWYDHNKQKFYSHLECAKKSIDAMDYVIQCILHSDLPNSEKIFPYAFWYCAMCKDYCTETLYYKITDREKAIKSSKYVGALGYSQEEKREYIKKYDDMCLEIRKFQNDFEKLKDKWSYGFPRLDPPSTYEEQQRLNQTERILQLQKEMEIEKALVQWRLAGGPAKEFREKKIREYMAVHFEERVFYQKLKKQVDELNALIREQKQKQNNENRQYGYCLDQINLLKAENEKNNEIIFRLNKKIFGKTKTKEAIEGIRDEISKNEKKVLALQNEMSQIQKEIEIIEHQIAEKVKEKEFQQRKIDMFLNKCII